MDELDSPTVLCEVTGLSWGRVEKFTVEEASESIRRWKRKSRERSSLGGGGSSRLRAFGGDASRHHLGELKIRDKMPFIKDKMPFIMRENLSKFHTRH